MATKSVAAQMFTIRDFCKTPPDIAASCRKLSRIGYSLVQVSAVGPIEAGELKKILDDNALHCVATHTHWKALTEGIDGLIEELKTLQCGLTAIGGMPVDMRTPEGLKPFAEGMNKAARALKAEGIELGYHNHSFEFEPLSDGRLLMDHLMELTAAGNMWAEIDTYWVQHGGGDPAAWIRKVAGRAPLIHLKDMGILQGQQVMREVGEGNLNWPAILDAARAAGVKYFAVEQDRCNGLDPFDCLATSYNNLRAMGLE
ncbi:MAG: sugar phosphate isomerase/epimerase [Planctomycetes bacterium]|nr:sugar phosphate isomerase/epimerase [Planctomycetota bacterium]